MSDAPKSFRDVIELWPSKEAMADTVGAKSSAVSKWWQRDNIPPEWWQSILLSRTAEDAGLTAEMLTTLAAAGRTDAGSLAEARV